MSPSREALTRRPLASGDAKTELTDGILSADDAAACARLTLQWLGGHAGVDRSLCLLAQGEPSRLVGVAAHGVAAAKVSSFSVPLDDGDHPLMLAVEGREPVPFGRRPRRSRVTRPLPETPFGEQPFWAVPLAPRDLPAGDPALGLLLVAGLDGEGLRDDVRWATDLMAMRLLNLRYRQARDAEGRQERVRAEVGAERLCEQVMRHSLELKETVREATAELVAQNEVLQRQKLALEQASHLKGQFLANISHELRTPLNAILGYTHLLLQGVGGEVQPKQKDKLSRIDSNARHLLAMISDLLDIARMEGGKLPVHTETFAVGDLMAEVLAEMAPVIARTHLTVRSELDPKLPKLRSDRPKVKQIIVNLLSNALKFTPEGSVGLHGSHEEEKDEIVLGVSDTGIGIAPEQQERIFEDFHQADSSFTRQYGGPGLGLSLCRRLALTLGGRISLVSSPGAGSSFTLHLPRRLTGKGGRHPQRPAP